MPRARADNIEDLWADLPRLLNKAKDGAADAEARRWIGGDLADDLLKAGAGRLLLDESQGGLGGTLVDWIRMGTELAAADGSTGWVASHWAMASAVVAANGSDALVEEVFSNPKACVASSNLGRVDFSRENDGLRISGSWGFASGCLAATHVGGDLLLEDPNAAGGFRTISVLTPRANASISETWDPVGMAASGSNQIVFDDVRIPASGIYDWPDSKPVKSRPRAFLGHGVWLITLSVAAVQLGLARAAIDAVREELTGKIDKATGEPAISKPATLRALEEAEGLLFSLRAGLERAAERLWAEGMRDGNPTAQARIETRLASLTAVHQGTAIVRSVFDVAGASAILRTGRLQRIFRDASCLIHHISSVRERFELVGMVRHDLAPLSYAI
ncbi:MAG: acyl-CoA dehydrogenase family protein [Rhizobiaceae bacterium]